MVNRWLTRSRPKEIPSPRAFTQLKPETSFNAIGDVHGCSDLLDVLLEKIDPAQDQRLIFLGDYVDRGPNTAATLERLYVMTQQRPDDVICLMGNHEKMMLKFLDDPLGQGSNWLRHGGVETLASYGIDGVSGRASPDAAIAACEAFERALPIEIAQWLRQLPLQWQSGNICCTHAAMDPTIAPSAQAAKTMLWGHRDFLGIDRADDFVVVHGHTTVSAPARHASRIAIDTGAHKTGRLTAACIRHDHCAFITT